MQKEYEYCLAEASGIAIFLKRLAMVKAILNRNR